MKTENPTIRLILHGLPETRLQSLRRHGVRAVNSRGHDYHASDCFMDFLVTSATSLDDSFIDAFYAKAASKMRLLIFNQRLSTDRLLSRFMDLQIRSPHRFYVAELKCDTELREQWKSIEALLKRLTVGVGAKDSYRILDARIEDGCLRLVSPDFERLKVPLSKIPVLSKIESSRVEEFEIDEDGSYIYWPDFDIHVGWEQLHEIVDPEAARKAMQKNHEFNVRYGSAIRRLREQAAIPITGISGLSEKP